ncbi:MAG: DUF6600 domain-containing protein [Thermoanaerobaculia bacterium]
MNKNRIAILMLLAAASAGAAAAQSDPYGPPGGQGQQGQYGEQYQDYGQGGYDDDWNESDNWYDDQSNGDYDQRDQYGSYGNNGGYDDRGYAPAVDVGFFYGALSPYGEWVRHPYYGWVWFPRNVRAGWRPYSIGRWVDSDYGWTWVSYERFGWATYHYGRWAWDRHVGWLWVPGTDWAPAWVAWQQGHGYIGWAPLPPAVGFDFRVGIQLGGLSLNFGIAPRNYAFVEERRFLDTRIGGYIVPEARNVTIIHNTTNITNYTVVDNRVINHGVPIERVERATGRRAQRMRIASSSTPGTTQVERDVVRIYRPEERKLDSVKVGRRNNAGLRKVERPAQAPNERAPKVQGSGGAPVQNSTPRPYAPGQKQRQGVEVPIPVAPRVAPAPQKVNERQFTREQDELRANEEKKQRSLDQAQRRESAAAEKAQADAANAQKVQQQHAAERKEQQVLRERTAEQLQNRQQIQRQAAKATAEKEEEAPPPAEQPNQKKGGKAKKETATEQQQKAKGQKHKDPKDDEEDQKPPKAF